MTANNRVVSDRYPWRLTADWPEPYRARRITDRLTASAKLSPGDMVSIQMDEVSYQARDLVPQLLDAVPAGAAAREALDRLRGWDFSFAEDSVPASIYAAWYVALAEMPADENGRPSRHRPHALSDQRPALELALVRRRAHARTARPAPISRRPL